MLPNKNKTEVLLDEGLTAVEKQFYELEIADLNKKLAVLRSHKINSEKHNEELDIRMGQMEEDRQDVTAYLNRALNDKIKEIQKLEDKLTELSKVRREENENAKKHIKESKAVNELLSSEILAMDTELKTLGKFRMERDELIARFDTQQKNFMEEGKQHKATLLDMERNMILNKKRISQDVENKLFEMSTAFTKTSDVRVAASTQRLLRENIALNNEMDRMTFTQERLQRENDEMKKKHVEIAGLFESSEAEKKRLIRTAEQRLEIIERLTTEYETILEQNAYLKEIKRGNEADRKTSKTNRGELTELQKKIKILEQHIRVIECDRQQLKCGMIYYHQEFDRASGIIKYVRLLVKSVMKGELDQDDPAFRDHQRKNLLINLLDTLNELEKSGKQPSLATIPSIKDIDSHSSETVSKESSCKTIENVPMLKIHSSFLTPSIQSVNILETAEESETENELIDPISASGSILFSSEGGSLSLGAHESETIFQKQIRITEMKSFYSRKSQEQKSDVENETATDADVETSEDILKESKEGFEGVVTDEGKEMSDAREEGDEDVQDEDQTTNP